MKKSAKWPGFGKIDRMKKSVKWLVFGKIDRMKKSAKWLVFRKIDHRKKWLVLCRKVAGKKTTKFGAKKSMGRDRTHDLML